MPKGCRRKHNTCSTKEPGAQLLFLDKANGALPRSNASPTLRLQHGRRHGRCHNGSTWHLSGYDLSETCKKATDIYAILAANLEHPCHSLHSIDYAPQLLVTRWPYDPE